MLLQLFWCSRTFVNIGTWGHCVKRYAVCSHILSHVIHWTGL